MKSSPRKSWAAKYDESKQWHRWYAWRPVPVSLGNDSKFFKWVWLEEIERCYFSGYDGGCWAYRIKK